MEYTSKTLIEFLKNLIIFDKDSRAVMNAVTYKIKEREEEEKKEWQHVSYRAQIEAKDYLTKIQNIISQSKQQVENTFSQNVRSKEWIFNRLEKCKEALILISNTEDSIINKKIYGANKGNESTKIVITVDNIILKRIDFVEMAYNLNQVLQGIEKKDVASTSTIK